MATARKIRTLYVCQSCGTEAPKWQGRCNSCGAWNALIEEQRAIGQAAHAAAPVPLSAERAQPQQLAELDPATSPRLAVPFGALAAVLGGGLVPGAVMLLAGDPGIGKSTLLLQLAVALADLKVLYVSGEESEQQIKLRANRMQAEAANCYVISETCLEHILQHLEALQPDMLIIDSIQTLYSLSLDAVAGSVAQIRHGSWALSRWAKAEQKPLFLVGHVTKEGSIAGPKVLEHMVDVVLQFEGERHRLYRALRATKNRFGSTHTLALYEMTETGLRDVERPSSVLLSGQHMPSGVALALVVEGVRSMLVEVQSLVSSATPRMAQRVITGLDLKRLHVLLALLEKRTGMPFGSQDVFVNLAGGFSIEDRGLDLALCMSLASSLRDKPLPDGIGFAAEVGLVGELRPVQRLEARMAEAQQLGLKHIYISAFHKGMPNTPKTLSLHPCKSIEEVLGDLLPT